MTTPETPAAGGGAALAPGRRVYVAGPMSGYVEHNFPAFDAARDRLAAAGWDVVSPADLSRSVGDVGQPDGTCTAQQYAAFFRLDIAAILDVGAVALLPGWDRSRGARLELHLAQVLGLDVLSAETGEPLAAPAVCTTLGEAPAPDESATVRELRAAYDALYAQVAEAEQKAADAERELAAMLTVHGHEHCIAVNDHRRALAALEAERDAAKTTIAAAMTVIGATRTEREEGALAAAATFEAARADAERQRVEVCHALGCAEAEDLLARAHEVHAWATRAELRLTAAVEALAALNGEAKAWRRERGELWGRVTDAERERDDARDALRDVASQLDRRDVPLAMLPVDRIAWLDDRRQARIADLEARAGRLAAALRKHGDHPPGCEKVWHVTPQRACTCGLDAALRADARPPHPRRRARRCREAAGEVGGAARPPAAAATDTHPALDAAPPGDDCPECGAPLIDLYGGDGSSDVPPIGLCCSECDYEWWHLRPAVASDASDASPAPAPPPDRPADAILASARGTDRTTYGRPDPRFNDAHTPPEPTPDAHA